MGIETLAMLHNDLIKVSCENCNEQSAKDLNCSLQNVDSPVYYCEKRDVEFYACPIAMIPRVVASWFERYNYDKEFGNSTPYNDCDAMYWNFVRRYTSHCNRFEMDKIKGGTRGNTK